jgi:hypothetical protein
LKEREGEREKDKERERERKGMEGEREGEGEREDAKLLERVKWLVERYRQTLNDIAELEREREEEEERERQRLKEIEDAEREREEGEGDGEYDEDEEVDGERDDGASARGRESDDEDGESVLSGSLAPALRPPAPRGGTAGSKRSKKGEREKEREKNVLLRQSNPFIKPKSCKSVCLFVYSNELISLSLSLSLSNFFLSLCNSVSQSLGQAAVTQSIGLDECEGRTTPGRTHSPAQHQPALPRHQEPLSGYLLPQCFLCRGRRRRRGRERERQDWGHECGHECVSPRELSRQHRQWRRRGTSARHSPAGPGPGRGRELLLQ